MQRILRTRQLIPPVTARTADGKQIHAWDYKQKRNLAIAFLHADCSDCTDWLAALAEHRPELIEREAVVLVIYSEAPARPLASPAPIILATDSSSRSQIAFLGSEAFGSNGLARVGVFVTDRFWRNRRTVGGTRS